MGGDSAAWCANTSHGSDGGLGDANSQEKSAQVVFPELLKPFFLPVYRSRANPLAWASW